MQERHEILEAMSELKLYGMRASFDEVAGKGLTRRDEIFPLIASLISGPNAPIAKRARSAIASPALSSRCSKIWMPFTFTDTAVDEGQVRELATGSFLDAKRNAIFIGGTGTGKTHHV